MSSNDYTDHHYVPQWYQRRFLPTSGEAKFQYLDLTPETFIDAKGVRRCKTALWRWGTKKCFQEPHLYTTKFGSWQSTDIEKFFFGKVDDDGARAVEWFSHFDHENLRGSHEAFHYLLTFMSVQKLRTPKGLGYIAGLRKNMDKNTALMVMQKLQNIHCSIWSEAVWAIIEANTTSTKFIISDHPVTVYNRDCFPEGEQCLGDKDPDIWLSGTHTLFPLSPIRLLVLTNLSWVRDPYQRPIKERPNPNPFRDAAMFSLLDIQTLRELTELEVNQINYIIKRRARRFIASPVEEWLYPEEKIPTTHWRKLDDRYLFMPDPRSVTFGGEQIVRYESGAVEGWDEYGHKPGQRGYDDKARHDREWRTFHAFQGEYARLFGPRRRGRCHEVGRLSNEEDSPDFHASRLRMEEKFLPTKVKRHKDRRATERSR